MASIVIHSRSGPDGKLHLEVPVGRANAEFEVEVVVRPATPDTAAARQEYLDFLHKTAGAWQGDFERPEQGPPEERDPL